MDKWPTTNDPLTGRLRVAANESSFSVEDWYQALRELDAWLDDRQRRESLERKLGYLSCCAELAARHPLRPSLILVLQEMLETHGLEAEGG